MTRTFWLAVVVAVIGLFLLIAGIGPLLLDIVVVLLGVVVAVRTRTGRQGSGSSARRQTGVAHGANRSVGACLRSGSVHTLAGRVVRNCS